jgi:hypothetical protein
MMPPALWSELSDMDNATVAQKLSKSFMAGFSAAVAPQLRAKGSLLGKVGLTTNTKVLKKGGRDALTTLGIRPDQVFAADGSCKSPWLPTTRRPTRSRAAGALRTRRTQLATPCAYAGRPNRPPSNARTWAGRFAPSRAAEWSPRQVLDLRPASRPTRWTRTPSPFPRRCPGFDRAPALRAPQPLLLDTSACPEGCHMSSAR